MATKQYKVVREIRDQDRFFANYPEYASYRMYQVEIPNGGMYQKLTQYLVTRESCLPGQTLLVDEGSEILPVRERSGSIHLGGTKVAVYRPERYLSEDFRILSAVQDGEPVEKFAGKEMDRRFYYLYEAEREGTQGYKGVLVRIFTKAMHVPGMAIPANEAVGLPSRNSLELPYYYHDTESRAYINRLWKSIRHAAGGH